MNAAIRTANGALMRPPLLGLMAWTTVLLWTPLAHTLMVLQYGQMAVVPAYLVSFLVGLAGWIMVWKGFKADDLPATIMGFMGGGLIWLGWMEGSFEFMGHWLNPPKLMFMGVELFTANLLLLQATGVILVALLIWLGSNKDTHCRMFMWFHRNLKLTPARRTPGYKRQFSRIVALEVIMINWFFYVLILWLFDPRVLGPFHSGDDCRGLRGAALGTVAAVLPHAAVPAAGRRGALRRTLRQRAVVLRRSRVRLAALHGAMDLSVPVPFHQRDHPAGISRRTGLVRGPAQGRVGIPNRSSGMSSHS